MLIGAGIALTLIVVFLSGTGEPDPAWGKFWMIRPLVVVPFAGAMGGVFYHLMSPVRAKGGWKQVLAVILCVIVYVFGLWIGTILGLDGTYWN